MGQFPGPGTDGDRRTVPAGGDEPAGDTSMKPEEYSRRQQEVGRWKINIISFKLGDRYYCTVDNVEPGAWLARAESGTRAEAERIAIEKATAMLSRTRVTG